MPGPSRRTVLQGLLAAPGLGTSSRALAATIERPDVVVVGAGIAGLTAARRLQEGGRTVIVLEASGRVGGRIRTSRRGGVPVELGMKFVPTGARSMMRLLKSAGLASSLENIRPWFVSVRDGIPHRVRWDRPGSFRRSGLISHGSFLQAVRADGEVLRRTAGLDLDDFGSWGRLDELSARDWTMRVLGTEFTQAITEPVLGGVYFQSVDDVSVAEILWSIRQVRIGPLRLLPEGLDLLPETLAVGLDLRLNEPVTRVDRSGALVRVETARATYEAAAVIVAVPAPVARSVVGDVRPAESLLLAVRYSSTIAVTFWGRWSLEDRAEYAGVHGVYYGLDESPAVASISVEAGMRPELWGGQGALQVFLREDAARALEDASDEAVVDVAMKAVSALAPGVADAKDSAEVQRWPFAVPIAAPGRVRTVVDYRAAADPRLLFVGDMHGFPSSNAAVFSARWAAGRILDGP